MPQKPYVSRLSDRCAEFPGSKYFAYLRDMVACPDLDSRILIEIPAYREPELVSTVRSAIAQAANPHRIFFAVCFQDDNLETLKLLPKEPRCRVKHFYVRDAPGTCAARYEASLLHAGEEYVLHIDAHMRFASFWDVALIDQYRRCPSPKRVISEYSMNFGQWYPVGPVAPVLDANAFVGGVTINLFKFQDNGTPRFVGNARFAGPDPHRGAFIGAGFSFSEAAMDEDVPVDPECYFTGDECLMDVRLWTHGYDVYHPGVRPLYHLYGNWRPMRTPSKDEPDPDRIIRLSENESLRRMQLFGVRDTGLDLGRFGHGDERTLQSYYDFCGVDFKGRHARLFAEQCLFGEDPYPDDKMAMAVIGGTRLVETAPSMLRLPTGGQAEKRIFVIVAVLDGGDTLSECIRSLACNASHPDRVSILVIHGGVERKRLVGARRYRASMLRVSSCGIGAFMRAGEDRIPSDADYVLYCDSRSYFVQGWDDAFVTYSVYCGKRSAISDWCLTIQYGHPRPLKPEQGRVLCSKGSGKGGVPAVTFGRHVDAAHPVKGAFTAWFNSFVPADIARSVKHDPGMYLESSEAFMTFSYWCNGVDVYHAPKRYAYRFVEDLSWRDTQAMKDMEDLSRARLSDMLTRGDSFGHIRNMSSFSVFSGFDPVRSAASMRSACGMFSDDYGAGALKSGSVSDCVTAGESWATNLRCISGDSTSYTMCSVDGCVYLGLPTDSVIVPSMVRNKAVWAKSGMESFFALAKKFYGVSTEKSGIFFDIGANIGTTGIHFKKNIDKSVRVVAFEPAIDTYRVLCANAALNGFGPDEFTGVNMGVSDDGVTYGVHDNVGNPGARYLERVAEGGVKTVRFDDYVRGNNIDPGDIKYIWVDTEGFEGAFLCGAVDILSRISVPLVLEFTSQFLCRFNYAEKFLSALGSLYSGYVKLGDRDMRVASIDELKQYFNDDFSLKKAAQFDIFMVK